jgi:hypothetical protein
MDESEAERSDQRGKKRAARQREQDPSCASPAAAD